MRSIFSALCLIGATTIASANVQEAKMVTGKIRSSQQSELILPDGVKYSMKNLDAKKHLTPVKPAKAGEEKVTVTLRVSGDLAPDGGSVYNKEIMETVYFDGYETTVEVPKGTYDMYVDFYKSAYYCVYRENVEITGDTVIEFDKAEANIPIEFHFFDENNNELHQDVYADGEFVKPATVSGLNKLSTIIHKDYGPTGILMSGDFTDANYPMELFVNKLSENYAFILGASMNVGAKYYVYKGYVDEFVPTVVNTNPANLKKLVSDFTPTPAMKDAPEAHMPGAEFIMTNDGLSFLNMRSWTGDEPDGSNRAVTYIDCPEAGKDDAVKYNLITAPVMSDTYEIIADKYGDYWEFTHIRGCSVIGNAADGVRYINGGADLDRAGFNIPVGGYYNQYYPGHPEFSFDCPDGKAHFGNNTPLLVYRAMKFKTGSTVQGIEKFRYVGRYGETFETDVELADVKYSDVSGGEKITIVNENVSVDGMPGKNTAAIVYDNGKEDFTAPTFQMLSFKNAEGVMTDRFETVNGARMMVAGGDFHYVDTGDLGYYECHEPATVKAFYAPHGTEEWAELSLVEDKDKFFMPAFGHYYEADLGGVSADGQGVWFDVRLEIADASGNSQTQTISPAFQINSKGSAVEQVAADADNALVVTGKTVMLANGENAEMTVYSVDGRTLQSVYAGNVDLGGMESGIYIVTAVTADGSVFSVKVAL